MTSISLTEREIVTALLKATNREMSLGSLFIHVIRPPPIIRKSLKKLVLKNVVYGTVSNTFTKYGLTAEYEKTFLRRVVVCPKCKTPKEIFFRGQQSTRCKNPNCITRSGRRTSFFLIRRPNVYSTTRQNVLEE